MFLNRVYHSGLVKATQSVVGHTWTQRTVCFAPNQPQGAHLVSNIKQKTWSFVSLLLQPIARSNGSQKYRNYKLGEFSLSTQTDNKIQRTRLFHYSNRFHRFYSENTVDIWRG